MCVHVCVHTVWMHLYPLFQLGKKHSFFLGCHVGEHQIVLSVVWARVDQNYALHMTCTHQCFFVCAFMCAGKRAYVCACLRAYVDT